MIHKIFKVAALDALPGIVDRQQVSGGSVGHGLQSGAHSGVIDHVEHDLHALTFLTEQIADTLSLAAQRHAAGGAGMNAVLFFDVRADDVIAVADTAVIIDKKFGDQKQGYALGTWRVAFDAGQNRVDNLLSQIVFSIGDKDFTACQGVGPIIISDCRRRQRTDIGSGIRLGQKHGAAPIGRRELSDIFFFLFGRTIQID